MVSLPDANPYQPPQSDVDRPPPPRLSREIVLEGVITLEDLQAARDLTGVTADERIQWGFGVFLMAVVAGLIVTTQLSILPATALAPWLLVAIAVIFVNLMLWLGAGLFQRLRKRRVPSLVTIGYLCRSEGCELTQGALQQQADWDFFTRFTADENLIVLTQPSGGVCLIPRRFGKERDWQDVRDFLDERFHWQVQYGPRQKPSRQKLVGWRLSGFQRTR